MGRHTWVDIEITHNQDILLVDSSPQQFDKVTHKISLHIEKTTANVYFLYPRRVPLFRFFVEGRCNTNDLMGHIYFTNPEP